MRTLLTPVAVLLLIGAAGCSRTERTAPAPETPKAAPQDASPGGGRVEAVAALVVGLFPDTRDKRFVCESPLQPVWVPFMNCHVQSEDRRVLEVSVLYGKGNRPWFAGLRGPLVHTEKLVALKDASGTRYGPAAEADVRKRLAEVEPLIETFIQRELGQATLAMRRVPMTLDEQTKSSVIAWRASYQGATVGYIDIEPIGGSVIHVEF